MTSKFSQEKLDFEHDGGCLTRDQPLKISKDIYLDDEKVMGGVDLVFKELVIKIADKPLHFTMTPYLMDSDKI